VRFALGLGLLLIPTCVGLLATRFNVPQALWGLIVESGFTEAGPAVGAEWYARALTYPTAAFALLFGLTALCQSRTQFSSTTGLGSLGLVVLTVFLERWLQPRTSWWTPFAVLALTAVVAVVTSAFLYMRKEGVSRPVRQGHDRRWIVVVIAGALLFLLLLFSTGRPSVRHTPTPGSETDSHKHETTNTNGGF